MYRVENFIVEGQGFFALKPDRENFENLKKLVIEFMLNEGFRIITNPFFGTRFHSIRFRVNPRGDIYRLPLFIRIRKFLQLISEQEINQHLHFKELDSTRDDLPYEVSFGIVPSKDMEGLIINIKSEPCILFKMRQFVGYRPVLDEFDRSNIIDVNKSFLKNIFVGLGAVILINPQAQVEVIRTPIIDKLEKFGFNDVSNLLIKGKSKVEMGNIEDGLTDLRSSMESLWED